MLQTAGERIDLKARRRDRCLSRRPALGCRHLKCRDTALWPRHWYSGCGAPRRLRRALRQLSRHARCAANHRHHAREYCRKAQLIVPQVECSRESVNLGPRVSGEAQRREWVDYSLAINQSPAACDIQLHIRTICHFLRTPVELQPMAAPYTIGYNAQSPAMPSRAGNS